MKNSTVPRTPVRSILATVLLTALGFLALGLQSVWAQNSTGSNLGGAFAARTSSSGTSLLAPFYWIPTAGAGFSVSSGTTAAPGAPSPNFSYFHSLSTMTVGNGYGAPVLTIAAIVIICIDMRHIPWESCNENCSHIALLLRHYDSHLRMQKCGSL